MCTLNPDAHTEDLLDEALNDALGQANAGADGGGAPLDGSAEAGRVGDDPVRELPPLPQPARGDGRWCLRRAGDGD